MRLEPCGCDFCSRGDAALIQASAHHLAPNHSETESLVLQPSPVSRPEMLVWGPRKKEKPETRGAWTECVISLARPTRSCVIL